MLVSVKENQIIDVENFKLYEYKQLKVYYSGVVFIRGKKAGIESLKYICDWYIQGVIKFREIFGAYAIYIVSDDNIFCFSDNSMMHGILYSDKFFGDDLVKIGRMIGSGINKKALCEFMTFQRPIYRESLLEGISVFPSEKYAVIKNGVVHIEDKNIGAIDDETNISEPKDFFRDVVYAINDKKVITALTGGYDSRLITAMYNYYAHADCFISGDNEKGDDIIWAKKAAQKGGLNLKHIVPKCIYKDGDKLIEHLYTMGGYKGDIDSSGNRITYFMEQLKREGYEILLTGNAGGNHKDFWYVRMVPIFPMKIFFNMERFARRCFIKSSKKQYLGENLTDVYNVLEEETYRMFKLCKRESVMKSCLCGGFIDYNANAFMQITCKDIVNYAPLQEFELNKYSYGIAPKGKRMCYFNRQLTSFYNEEMSKVKTIYGTTCSDKISYLIADEFRTMVYYITYVVKHILQKIKKKNLPVYKNVNKVDLIPLIKSSKTAKAAINWAKTSKYINQEITLDNVPDEILSKSIYVYMLYWDVTKENN